MTTYFTGKPCKHGHIAERFVSTRTCVECHRLRAAKKYHEDPEAAKRKVYGWRDKNPDKSAEHQRQYFERNSDSVRERARVGYAEDPAKVRAAVATYEAAKLQATPAWADMQKILEVYREAERLSLDTGVQHHVDHIIPLRSDIVCGLHVQWNLRAIPASDNCSKGNRWWPES